MPVTLSYSTQVFAAQPFEVALRWAKTLGLSAVEIGKDHAETLNRSDPARAEARRLAKELGVRLASAHAWRGMDGLAEVCRGVVEIDAALIVIHCRHEEIVADFDGCASALARWRAWTAERGVTLTVENSSRQPIEPFVRLFRAIPGLALTLDVKHAYKPKLFGLTHVDYLRELGDRVANLHLLGIDPSRDDLLGDGIPAGRDAIDYNDVVGDLARRGYAGLATVESSDPELPADQVDAAYFDLPPASPEAPTLGHRLSRHNVAFFRKAFGGN